MLIREDPLARGEVNFEQQAFPLEYGPAPDPPGLSMHDGLSTTVPTNIVVHNLNGTHQPTPRKEMKGGSRACRVKIMLVTFMFCLGVTISVLGVFLHIWGIASVRDCSIWAGIPLTVTGIFGIYFCGNEFASYETSTKAFVVKCICLVLSFLSCWLCILASIFTGIHLHRLWRYTHCKLSQDHTCLCLSTSTDPLAPQYFYNYSMCEDILGELWKYMLSLSVINAMGGVVCMWFMFILWKSRYQGVYAGQGIHPFSSSSISVSGPLG